MLETGTEVHVCSHCKAQFTITNKEKQFYLSKGLHLPKKCKKCRQERKAMIIKQEGFTLKDILVRR